MLTDSKYNLDNGHPMEVLILTEYFQPIGENSCVLTTGANDIPYDYLFRTATLRAKPTTEVMTEYWDHTIVPHIVERVPIFNVPIDTIPVAPEGSIFLTARPAKLLACTNEDSLLIRLRTPESKTMIVTVHLKQLGYGIQSNNYELGDAITLLLGYPSRTVPNALNRSTLFMTDYMDVQGYDI